ncbi:16S rRNA (guanine(966)-N(2))-methyltransferase RsmD [Maritalea myrionectae]|uniref:16S rRNA (guanine(966)-N(2))-methyltransferase RsmD n=1 Tax=Maritalea myrionectae TaxID=454601 RepID=UPI0003F6A6CB|nr:16S rRNA (guanine(966)-N(2))-methyltransferase RsmD [Maritalea myrionectae]
MRIVAGKFKSKTIASPQSDDIRPTSDRVRESLFNILANHFGPVMTGTRVLDLFAGTGALGLEALSRGAEHATFVDTGVEARALLRENIQEFGVAGQSRMLRRDATDLGQIQRILPCNLVFLDPPYAKGLGDKALAVAYEGGWIAPEAIVVLEEQKGVEVKAPDGFDLLDERTYGDTMIHLFKAPAV